MKNRILLSLVCLCMATFTQAQTTFDNAGVVYSNTPIMPKTTFGFANFNGGRTEFGLLLGTGYNLSLHFLTEVDKQGNLLLGGKIGYLNEDPYVSFQGDWYINKYLSFYSWDGYGLIEKDSPEAKELREGKFFLAKQQVTAKIWQLRVNYIFTYYEKDKLHNIVDINYFPKLGNYFSLYLGGGYDFSYGKAVYQLGLVFYYTNPCDRVKK